MSNFPLYVKGKQTVTLALINERIINIAVIIVLEKNCLVHFFPSPVNTEFT